MKAPRLLIISILIIFFSFQASTFGEGHVFFKSLGKENGLSNMAVSSIVQDSKGFLWFGTQGGLDRYDGYQFKTYKKKPFDSNSLSHDLIQTLFMDRDDVLWIGTYQGLNRLDLKTDTFTRYRNVPGDSESLSNDVVVSILRDDAGTLWIGTLNGLNALDEDTGKFRHYFNHEEQPYSLSNSTVRVLFSDSEGRLWIGTYGGLNLYRPGTDDFVNWVYEKGNPASIACNYVMVIEQTVPGELWLGTWGGGGLSRFIIETGTAENYTLADNRAYSLNTGKNGTLFIGTWGGGLIEFHEKDGTQKIYTYKSHDPSSLTHNIVYSLYLDTSGVLWIGTNGGGINTMRKPDTSFTYWANNPDDPDTLSMGKVTSILRDSQGLLWIGTYNGGLNRYDPEKDRMIHYIADPSRPGSISNDIITDIYEDSSGNLWVCTNQGLNRYDRRADRFERWLDEDSDNPLPDQIVYGILEDIDNTLWIGTYNAGMVHYDPRTNKSTRYASEADNSRSLSDNLVYSIFLDSKANLWIGTNNGLNLYDRDSDDFTCYYHDENDPATLTSNTVRDIYEDRNGDFWIGTVSGGLNMLDRDTERFSHYLIDDGLPSNTVYGIQEDFRGRLWMNTMNHLVIFDAGKNEFQVIDEDKGLWSQEFAKGHFTDRDGNLLYFGSSKGLYAIKPGDFTRNTHVPPVYLTSFKIFDREIEFERSLQETQFIEVEYSDKFIAFEFAALDYVNPGKNQYSYKLEGFDSEWVNSGSRRYASYTNLSPGSYIFRVRASNNDKVWNMNGLAVNLRVIPPFWRSTWAYVFYILLLISFGFFIFIMTNRSQKANVLKKTRELDLIRLTELEKEIRERCKVEAELILARDEAERANHTKSNFIANISHEIRTPLNSIIGYTQLVRNETKEKSIHGFLDIIKKSGNQLLNLINDLLDLSVIESGKLRIHKIPMKLDEVVEDLYTTYGFRIGEKGLKFEVRIHPGTPKTIYADTLRLRQILFNLVGNALKFTEQGKIEVYIQGTRTEQEKPEEGQRELFIDLVFRVTDTGIGIAPEVRDSIFEAFIQEKGKADKYGGTGLGLAISRELTEAMGGTIEVSSEVDRGSIFTVFFPRVRTFDDQHYEETPSLSFPVSEKEPRTESDYIASGFSGESENTEELVRWIETEGLPGWKEISAFIFLDDWGRFAEILQAKGRAHSCDDLISYGTALADCIARGRLSQLRKMGALFPVLAETLKENTEVR